MAQKRHIATVDFYFWAEENEDPKEVLQKFVDEQRSKEDNQMNILTIHEAPFATMNCKQIYPNNN